MRSITREDIEFLTGLQHELNTQTTVCQADPRFWVVRDSSWEPCWNENAERFVLLKGGEKIGVLDDFCDDLPAGFDCVPERKVAFNVNNTFFMTLRECSEHIKRNRHHYSDGAHAFAMTAWRSPQVEQLWRILHEVNWDELNIVEGS